MSGISFVLPFVWGFGSSFCYALIFNADFKGLLWTPFIGSLGWGLYTLFSALLGIQTFAYFFAAFCVAAFAEIFAVAVRSPATVFLIPGLISLVPGSDMFQTMRAAVQGDMENAVRIGFRAFSAAGAIVLGLAIASSFARIVFVVLKRRNEKR